MQIKEETIKTDRLMHRIICSCPECGIDFTISTGSDILSEVLGTPTNRVYCPVCLRETVVDDKEDEYI
jgi:hypothetical protein